jgi:flagellar protein FliS
MQSEARDAYLENQILSAPPHRLRLMLIEGAQRFCRQALQQWQCGEGEAGLASLGRARGVVSELLSSVQPEDSPLARRVAGIYLYLFRTLAEAALDKNEQQVCEVIEVLDIERETWRLVCEQASTGMPRARAASPALPDLDTDTSSSGGGLMLEA